VSIIRHLNLQVCVKCFLRRRHSLRGRKILDSVAVEDSIRRLRNVVVLLDGGFVRHQVVLIASREPVVDRDSLDVTDVFPQPLLHETVEACVHCFRHLRMCKFGALQRVASVENVIFRKEDGLVGVVIELDLLLIVNEAVAERV